MIVPFKLSWLPTLRNQKVSFKNTNIFLDDSIWAETKRFFTEFLYDEELIKSAGVVDSVLLPGVEVA